MLNYLIFFSFDSSAPSLRDIFLSRLKECGLEIKEINQNYIEGLGSKNSLSFIKQIVKHLTDLELNENDEIKISYPTVSRIDMNLYPDIETVKIKTKGTKKIASPFRFSYN
jgi:hypothetical protein